MNPWVRLDGPPVRYLYRDNSALLYLDKSKARHKVLVSIAPLRSSVDGESPNLTITLSNERGETSALLLDPPLGQHAVVQSEDGDLFAGTVSAVTLSKDACTLQVSL